MPGTGLHLLPVVLGTDGFDSLVALNLLMGFDVVVAIVRQCPPAALGTWLL